MKNNIIVLSVLSVFATQHSFSQESSYNFLKPIKLDSSINTNCDETSPVISSDGNTLFFSRVMCRQNIGGETAGQDIWYAVKEQNGKWSKSFNLKAPLNNQYENAPIALSEDNKTLYVSNVYRGGEKMAPGISKVVKKNDTLWDFPKLVNIKNFAFKKNTFVNFGVSRNEKHVIISRYKKDSTDMEDLFISHKDDKGNWSDPINMGDNVNSAGYETSPFLADDDSTLYFSSNGLGGFGDADIFVSKRLDNTWKKWSRPVNLGNVINTKGFDGYFTILNNGIAYYVSGDNTKSLGDIYYTQKVRSFNYLNISLINTKSGMPVQLATVTSAFRNNKEVISKTTSNNGTVSIKIGTEPKRYYFVAHANGYISTEQPLDINQTMINRDTTLNIYMSPFEVGQTIRLNNIFFETGKATLLEESNIELEVLIEVLIENPNMQILVSGHTDNVGKPKANQKLSEDRVKSVNNYLIAKGIAANRLRFKGFGSTKPLADNKTDEGRTKNRRVEFKILKK